MAIIDGEQYVSVNQPFADLYGFSRPDELAGESWEYCLAENERERFERKILPMCRADGQWRGRVAGRRRDDGIVSQELTIARLDDHFIYTAREIDSNGQAENELADCQRLLRRERELERYKTTIETVDDGVYALDEDLRFSFVNDRLCKMTEMSREDLVGTPVTELFEYDDEVAAAAEIRQRVLESDTSVGTIQGTLPTSDGERILEARYRLHPEPDGEYRGSIGVVRDVTEREERERQLERRRDELETLNQINELLLQIARDLFSSPTRTEIEQMVCDRLATSHLYQFAWIGAPDSVRQRIAPRASAGIDEGYVESITVTATETETGQGPGGRAFRTRTCTCVRTSARTRRSNLGVKRLWTVASNRLLRFRWLTVIRRTES
ncbi:PAS domain-containing protein [Saliphagus sp. GCM10025308]